MRFALDRPGLFRVMFGGVCDTGAWALVHGLAFLFLDGKLDSSSPKAVAARVCTVVSATLGLTR